MVLRYGVNVHRRIEMSPIFNVNGIQWNPIAATLAWGTTFWPLYIGVAFIEGLFCTQIVHL